MTRTLCLLITCYIPGEQMPLHTMDYLRTPYIPEGTATCPSCQLVWQRYLGIQQVDGYLAYLSLDGEDPLQERFSLWALHALHRYLFLLVSSKISSPFFPLCLSSRYPDKFDNQESSLNERGMNIFGCNNRLFRSNRFFSQGIKNRFLIWKNQSIGHKKDKLASNADYRKIVNINQKQDQTQYSCLGQPHTPQAVSHQIVRKVLLYLKDNFWTTRVPWTPTHSSLFPHQQETPSLSLEKSASRDGYWKWLFNNDYKSQTT